jgi:hypothetical protein
MEPNETYLRRSQDIVCDLLLFPSRIEVRVNPGELDEEAVKRVISRVQHFAGDGRYPILVNPDKNTKISFFGVRALASDAAMNYATATAYIIRSFHHQMMADMLFSMYTTSRPVRVFKEHAEARNWLQTFPK